MDDAHAISEEFMSYLKRGGKLNPVLERVKRIIRVSSPGYKYFNFWISIIFTAKDTVSGNIYSITFYEGERGLIQAGPQRAVGIIGNSTNVTLPMGVGQSITVAGIYFSPNNVTLYWDNIVIGSAAVNASGSFSTNIIVPICNVGWHTLTINDKNTAFCVYIKVTSHNKQ